MTIQLPSARQHNFSKQPSVNIQRSAFDRKHSNSFTFNAGFLVPFFHDEILPGDTMNFRSTLFARLNTPYFPIMTNVYLMRHYWFVPNRLVWDNWVYFMGEKATPDDTTTYLTPQSTIPEGGYPVMSLQDYFDLPVVEEGGLDREGLAHNVFLLRAYNSIYNHAYRDQNLQDPVVVDLDDGPDDPADYSLLKRGKRHDYFTSALPWPQKGDPVGISLSGTLDVSGTGSIGSDGAAFALKSPSSTSASGFRPAAGTLGSSWETSAAVSSLSGDWEYNAGLEFDPAGGDPLTVTLADATSITINAFRQAFLTQELLEIDARGGTRYPEMVYAHFGVQNPDARVQYPEYLGGDITRLDITAVPQTSETTTESPQGNLASFGTIHAERDGFVKSFTEHGHVIALLCVYADLTYSQGLARHYSRRTRYDFYFPVFANLGEQAILNKEIYAQGTAGGDDDDTAFGYQERWAEYRYMPNRVGGLFRPGVAGSLAAWNLSQEFADLPPLNDEFIVENPPFNRVVVVTDEPDFKVDCYMELTHVRPMPVHSIPVKLGGGGRR